MRNKIRFLLSALIGVICIMAFGVVIFTTSTFAESTDFLQKAALTGLYQCYDKGGYRPLSASDYLNYSSIVGNSSAFTTYLPSGYTNTKTANCAQILNGTGSGVGSYSGLFASAGVTPPKNTDGPTAISSFMTQTMGYGTETADGGACVNFIYGRSTSITTLLSSTTSDGGQDSTMLCVKFKSGSGDSAVIDPGTFSVDTGSSTSETASNSFSNAIKIKTSSSKITCQRPTVGVTGLIKYVDSAVVNIDSSMTWGTLKDTLLSEGCAPESFDYSFVLGNPPTTTTYKYTRQTIDFPSYGEASASYTLEDKTKAASTAIRALSGGRYSNYSQLSLSESEKRTLLRDYLTDYYKMESRCGIIPGSTEANTALGDGFIGAYNMLDGFGAQQTNCYVRATTNQNERVNVYNSDGYLGFGNTMDFKQVVEELSEKVEAFPDEQKAACNDAALKARHDAEKILNDETKPGTLQSKATTTIMSLDAVLEKTDTKGKPEDEQIYWYEDSASGQIMCYSFTNLSGTTTSTENPVSGSTVDNDSSSSVTPLDNDDISMCKTATSLGWVICPFMSLLGNAAMGIYNEIGDQWVAINGEEVKTGTSLYNAWKGFRDYANIGFAIVFAIVVLSQVTGIGLSNYSIKKILPNLIIVAVLVNVSFLICQLAIDLTNILGEGIGEAMQAIGGEAAKKAGMFGTKGAEAFVNIVGLAGVGLGGYAAAPLIASIGIGTVIIPVILAVISALISYFFLFILLALRKATVYIVIILSPLAFICYALPNTKGIFDKWKKLFISLLIVFPICQVLVYGGQMMSIIMMANTDEKGLVYQITALLMQIVPIFFIPTLLRNSLAMLGNIGAKISAMGNKLGKGVSGFMGNTQLAKRAMTSMNRASANSLTKWKRMQKKPTTWLGKALRANTQARISNSLMAGAEMDKADKLNQNISRNGWYMDSISADNDLRAEEDASDKYLAGLRNKTILDANGDAYDMNDLDVEVAGDSTSRNGAMISLYADALRANDSVKIKALTKYLMNTKGDKGFNVIRAALQQRGIGFDENNKIMSRNNVERAGFNTATQYLAGNDKWNMMMKRWDPSTFQLVNDGARLDDSSVVMKDSKTGDPILDDNGNQVFKDLAHYQTVGAGKVTEGQTPNLGDGFFSNLRNFYNSDTSFAAAAADPSIQQSISQFNSTSQAAVANPRIYSQMGGALRDMQKVDKDHQEFNIISSILNMNKNNNINAGTARRILEEGIESGRYKIRELRPPRDLNVDHN